MEKHSSTLEYEPLEPELCEKIEKHFVNKFRKGYIRCKNAVLPSTFTRIGDKILHMDVRPDDIWVCSFPKAGTTWTQEMVWLIANDLNFEGSKTPLNERFPFVEITALIGDNPHFKTPSTIEGIENMSDQRFLKTHLPFNLLPLQLQKNSTNAKIIYVSRNARDTCVSYFHFSKLMMGYEGDFDTFCNLFLEDSVLYCPFWDNVFSFWEQKNSSNVLLLKYEDMKKDLRSVIKKTAAFLGKDISEEDVEELQEHLKFDNMKKNPAVNFESLIKSKTSNSQMNGTAKPINGTFMRCGKVDQWRDTMNPNIVNNFEQWEKNKFADSEFSISHVSINE